MYFSDLFFCFVCSFVGNISEMLNMGFAFSFLIGPVFPLFYFFTLMKVILSNFFTVLWSGDLVRNTSHKESARFVDSSSCRIISVCFFSLIF